VGVWGGGGWGGGGGGGRRFNADENDKRMQPTTDARNVVPFRIGKKGKRGGKLSSISAYGMEPHEQGGKGKSFWSKLRGSQRGTPGGGKDNVMNQVESQDVAELRVCSQRGKTRTMRASP